VGLLGELVEQIALVAEAERTMLTKPIYDVAIVEPLRVQLCVGGVDWR